MYQMFLVPTAHSHNEHIDASLLSLLQLSTDVHHSWKLLRCAVAWLLLINTVCKYVCLHTYMCALHAYVHAHMHVIVGGYIIDA